MIDLFYSPCVLMINEDLYNSWTDEQRTAFDKAAEEAKAVTEAADAGAADAGAADEKKEA